MFHVIKKPTDGGGKSVLVDGFYCASKLKQIDPSAFDFLTNTHVEMISVKEGVCHFRHSAPVIRLNSRNGEFEQIRYLILFYIISEIISLINLCLFEKT